MSVGGSKGSAMGGRGLLPVPACHRAGDHKEEGAGLGAGTASPAAPPEYPGTNLRKPVLWAFWRDAHREH